MSLSDRERVEGFHRSLLFEPQTASERIEGF